ncbi:DUF2795 domain-containing protein [Streptantibioticus parmotrematis]|uniref:DUF2795 domain-containing protein n=1 Tax=Streptantibioticus parmotrematis TaxID=2873249 RepID=UPI00340C814E
MASDPAELLQALAGAHYPASKEDLASRARDHGASDDLVRRLEQLPDKEINGPDEVDRAVFGDH